MFYEKMDSAASSAKIDHTRGELLLLKLKIRDYCVTIESSQLILFEFSTWHV